MAATLTSSPREGGKVEVSLQDLVLLPTTLEFQGRGRLTDLVEDVAPAAAAVVLEQAGELHGQGVLAPRVREFQRLPQALAATAFQSIPECS